MAVWKSTDLFEGIDTTKIKSAQDDYQFAFVDGRDNNIAKRVVIDADGVVVPTSVGMPKPLQAAIHTGFVFNRDNDEGTAIRKGKILLICYTYKNEEGDESNPSPVMVIDTMQFMSKGYWTLDGNIYQEPVEGGTYTYDLEMDGSIEAVTLSIPISESLAREVNVYVAEADYPESIIPPSSFRFTTSRRVPLGSTSISVTVASVPSDILVSQENDMAPKGDDITLVDGISFIANSVGNLGLPAKAVKVWKIAITNNNKFNYINRFHRIDLHDEAGAKPGGTTSFFDDLDWDTTDMTVIRLMDSDLTTPLEVYHYPLDSKVKLHVQQSEGTGERATLLVGNAGSLSSFLLAANNRGTAGNDIAIEIVKQPGTLLVDCSSATVTNYLILTPHTGVIAGTVTVVKPSSYNATLDLAVDGSNNITITLKTQDIAGFPAVSTGTEIKTLLTTAIGSGGDLEGVYDSVAEGADFDGAVVSIAHAIEYLSAPPSISVTGTVITVGVEYGASITSTAASICALISNSTDASALVKASVGVAPGNGYVAELTETNLAGGAGTSPVNSAEVLTRMLAFVRIPIVSAYSDSFIYLVKFDAAPTGLAGAFVPLKLSGATTGEMNLGDFYEDIVYANPVRNEDCILCGNDKVPATLSLTTGLRAAYELSNRANANWGVTEGASGYRYELDGTYPNLRIYDELANNTSLVAETPAYPCKRIFSNGPHIGFEADGIFMTSKGFVCAHNVLPYASNTTQIFFTLLGTALGDHTDGGSMIRVSRSDTTAGTARIVLYIRNHYTGNNNDITQYDYLDLPFSTDAPRNVFFCLTWDQVLHTGERTGSQLDLTLYAVYDGEVKTLSAIVTGGRVDVTGSLHIDVSTRATTATAYPAYPYLALGDKIKDEWQVISLQRSMPLYPIEGIGAYSEFASNGEDTPSLAWVNTNVFIETLSLDVDNRPGRIQWGAYGAMPNLNETSINEEILRIASLKSAMPTDEHNTILILTAKNVYRMALLGTEAKSCAIISELRNTGIVNAEAFCYTPTGIAWLSKQGIIMLEGNSYKNISRRIINTDAVTILRYDHVNNWIWARGTSTYVYQIDEGVWWKFSWLAFPDDFMSAISDEEGWIYYTTGIMYHPGSAANVSPYATKIKTKAYAINKKLGRFKLITTLVAGTYKVLVRLFGALITGVSTTTAQFTGTNNKVTAIPGTSGDYAQLELTEINNVAGVEIEYISGK